MAVFTTVRLLWPAGGKEEPSSASDLGRCAWGKVVCGGARVAGGSGPAPGDSHVAGHFYLYVVTLGIFVEPFGEETFEIRMRESVGRGQRWAGS